MAMPSVSKNLNTFCEHSAFDYNTTARTVSLDKREDLLNVRESWLQCRDCRYIYTLTEWKKRILRPVAKESLWHKYVRLFPVPRYKASQCLSL